MLSSIYPYTTTVQFFSCFAQQMSFSVKVYSKTMKPSSISCLHTHSIILLILLQSMAMGSYASRHLLCFHKRRYVFLNFQRNSSKLTTHIILQRNKIIFQGYYPVHVIFLCYVVPLYGNSIAYKFISQTRKQRS